MGLGVLIMVLVFSGSASLETVEAQAGASQSVRGGGVTVTVTPLNKPGEAPTFLVILDTHSVNLDAYKFEDIVRLRDGRGGDLAPAAVEGAEGGGHHRRATIRFALPEAKPKTLELVVNGVAGVPEREFRWTVE
jgi:hypothetical protein